MKRRFFVVWVMLTVILFCVMVLWSFSVEGGIWDVGWPHPFWTYGCEAADCVMEAFSKSTFWRDVGILAGISFIVALWYDGRKARKTRERNARDEKKR